jgi:transcriptional regulator with XRE-family HTH domain
MQRILTIEGRHGVMARAGLGLSVRQLAEMAVLDKATIVRFEAGMKLKGSTVAKIQKALEKEGAIFRVSCDGRHTWVGVPRRGEQPVPDIDGT